MKQKQRKAWNRMRRCLNSGIIKIIIVMVINSSTIIITTMTTVSNG